MLIMFDGVCRGVTYTQKGHRKGFFRQLDWNMGKK